VEQSLEQVQAVRIAVVQVTPEQGLRVARAIPRNPAAAVRRARAGQRNNSEAGMSILKLIVKMLLGAAVIVVVVAFGFSQQTQQMPSQSTAPAVTHHMSKAEKQKTAAGKGAVIDINSASKEDLAALPGSNPDLAQNIISGRPYAKKTDLLRKKVIPKQAYDKMQGQIIAKQNKNK
jgi:DNA uptake protein ComE-like DNA-binding protein